MQLFQHFFLAEARTTVFWRINKSSTFNKPESPFHWNQSKCDLVLLIHFFVFLSFWYSLFSSIVWGKVCSYHSSLLSSSLGVYSIYSYMKQTYLIMNIYKCVNYPFKAEPNTPDTNIHKFGTFMAFNLISIKFTLLANTFMFVWKSSLKSFIIGILCFMRTHQLIIQEPKIARHFTRMIC